MTTERTTEMTTEMIRDIILHAPSEAELISALDDAGLTTYQIEDGVSITTLSGIGWNCTPPTRVSVPTGKTVTVKMDDDYYVEQPEYVTLPGVYATLRLSGIDVDVSNITATNPPEGVPKFA
jgi:hypothetical protein